MQIVIEISSYDKEWITNGYYIPEEINMKISEAIANGIPLDKIRAELHATAEMHEDGDYYLREEWIDEIIDEYKAERNDKERSTFVSDYNIGYRDGKNGDYRPNDYNDIAVQEPVFYPQVDGITPTVVRQEPCEDTVSRIAEVELYREKVTDAFERGVLYGKHLASVQPSRPTGHWIYTGWVCQTDEILYGYGCSKCGAISFFRKSNNKILGGKWCHCCGMKMVNPQESEE